MLNWLNRRASLLEWIFVRGIIVFNVYILFVGFIVWLLFGMFGSWSLSIPLVGPVSATNLSEWIVTRVVVGAIGGIVGWVIQTQTDIRPAIDLDEEKDA